MIVNRILPFTEIQLLGFRRRWLERAALAGLLMLGATSAAMADSESIALNIPAQPAQSALVDFARQTGVEISFSAAEVGNVQTNAVVGNYSRERALRLLLAGTGLRAAFYSDKAVTVHKASATALDSDVVAVVGEQSIRLAQTDRAPDYDQRTGNSSEQNTQRSSASTTVLDTEEPKQLADVVITGSQIRGPGPVGANVITIDRTDIERSALATLPEVIQAIPQNYTGGANEDTFAPGVPAPAGAGGNIGGGSSVNLRGIGTDSTLVLLNGHRLASSGFLGNFVDVSNIPLTAVERVEILPDGASAIYGSDAVGGVVNVILRKDFDGVGARLRYGPDIGADTTQRKAGLTLGRTWNNGNAIIAYEFFSRDELASIDRRYTADSDLRSLGGDDFSSPFANPGNITNFVENFAIPPNQDGTSLTADQLLPGVINLQNIQQGTFILPDQEQHNVFATVSQDIADRFEVFATALYSKRDTEGRTRALTDFLVVPASNAFFVDPFGGSAAVFVQYSWFDDFGALPNIATTDAITGVVGGKARLGSSWQAEIEGSHSVIEVDATNRPIRNREFLAAALADSDPATAFNGFGDGSHTNPATLNSIVGSNENHVETELSTVSLKADGSIIDLAAGEGKLAVGVEYRDESLLNENRDSTIGIDPVLTVKDFDRDVVAAFAEIYLPLVGESNKRRGIRRLEFSVAARFEEYSDFGTTVDPKLGVRWSPALGLNLRGTVGMSFKAPLLSDLDPSGRGVFLNALPDPMSPTGFTNAIRITGVNPNLGPEEATTWTIGFDVNPKNAPAFDLGLTYFDTDIDGRIRRPFGTAQALVNADIFAPLITRDPDVDTVAALLADPDFFGTPSVPPEEVGAIIDIRLNNIAVTEVTGIDLRASYGVDTNIGTFRFEANGSYLVEFNEAITETAPVVDNVDTILFPADFTMRNSVTWGHLGFNATAFLNYTDSYTDNLSSPERTIGSWTTADLTVSYAADRIDESRIFDGMKFTLSVQNLFDRDPPFANFPSGVGYDPLQANPLNRFFAIEVTKQW